MLRRTPLPGICAFHVLEPAHAAAAAAAGGVSPACKKQHPPRRSTHPPAWRRTAANPPSFFIRKQVPGFVACTSPLNSPASPLQAAETPALANQQPHSMASTKILIIGATGYLGKHLVKEAVAQGHSTFALVRSSALSDPAKAELIESFKASGVAIHQGTLKDHDVLVSVLRQVDVVICSVNGGQVLDQYDLIAAIKEAGTIKRFIPSEFGNDVDRVSCLGPMGDIFERKKKIRRAVEEAGIPYTYVCNNSLAGYFLKNLIQADRDSPPRDHVTIWGSGDSKAIFVAEEDVAAFTIKAAVDPRASNKSLFIRPKENILSQNEVTAIWEKKIGKTLEKTVLPEDEIKKRAVESPFPENITYGAIHSIFVKGGQYCFDLGPDDLEATELYPEVKYVTVDEYLEKLK
eukprot:c13102_g1_i1 orf=463-1674(-)